MQPLENFFGKFGLNLGRFGQNLGKIWGNLDKLGKIWEKFD